MRVLSAVLALIFLCSVSAVADEPIEESTGTIETVESESSTEIESAPSNEIENTLQDDVDTETESSEDTETETDVDTISADTVTLQANTVLLASAAEDNEYPADAPLMGGLYMEVSTSQLGDLLIYIPTDYQYRSFTKTDSGEPVNITNSTISGYSYDGSSYYIRWSTFGTAQYRSSTGQSYSYSDLDITEIKNTNVVFVESNEDLPPVPDSDTTNVILIFMMGVIILCLFMKRF